MGIGRIVTDYVDTGNLAVCLNNLNIHVLPGSVPRICAGYSCVERIDCSGQVRRIDCAVTYDVHPGNHAVGLDHLYIHVRTRCGTVGT